MARTEIASHRGGAFLWPENSLLAFRNALALPAEQLELDVHLSADGVPVVMHDATLDRTTDGSGPVRAKTTAELRRVRLRGTSYATPLVAARIAEALRRSGDWRRTLDVEARDLGAPGPDAQFGRGLVCGTCGRS